MVRKRPSFSVMAFLAFLSVFPPPVYASTDPCGLGHVIGEAADQFGEDVLPRLLEAAKRSARPPEVTAKILRSSPGIARNTKALISSRKFLRGHSRVAGFKPHEIGEALNGKSFRSFDDFRRAYWKAVANSSYAVEFGEEAVVPMLRGLAPPVREGQSLGRRATYELHHITPIHRGGEVYDPANIMVVTPSFHKTVLSPDYHFGHGG